MTDDEEMAGSASWDRTTLGEICAGEGGGIQTGPFGSQLHASDYVDSGIPSVMPQNIGDNTIVEDGIARITEGDALRLEKYLLREGDIVYSRRGDVEKRALVRQHNAGWLCGTGCLRVRMPIRSENRATFISYLLGTPEARAWVSRHAVGATMPNLNTTILSNVPLRVPELSVQVAIADVLGALDDKIAANGSLASTAGALATLEFERALQDDSVVVVLNAVVELLARGITPTYTEESASMTVLNQKCVRDRRVDLNQSRKTSLGKVRPEKVLRLGDVLVNSTGYGTLGRVARWTKSVEVTVDSHITIVRLNGSKVERTCGGFGLLRLEAEIEGMGEGSTGQTELSRVELGKLPVRLPRADIQKRLSARLDALTELADAYMEESAQLAELRDTLLPHLMSGRLRVKDAEKQVEAVV